MNNIKMAIAIIEAEARDEINNAVTIEDKFRAAFNVARNHWMFTDEGTQQQAGIGAVLANIDQDSDDYRRIERELTMLRAIAAATSGVPVNMEALDDSEFEPVGIGGIWRESNEN